MVGETGKEVTILIDGDTQPLEATALLHDILVANVLAVALYELAERNCTISFILMPFHYLNFGSTFPGIGMQSSRVHGRRRIHVRAMPEAFPISV